MLQPVSAIRGNQHFVMSHLRCLVYTMGATVVDLLDQNVHASRFLPGFLGTKGRDFRVKEIPAEKTYRLGAIAHIALKSNTTGSREGIFQTIDPRFKGGLDEHHV